jgi:DNA-binding MarR family transcriptional regulator
MSASRTDAAARLHELAESFALTMAQGGMQKSTARVLAALLFAPEETLTAGDLCERLTLSSGAVSGAVKALAPLGLIERVPAPGSRRDHYRIRPGAWATLMSNQNTVLDTMVQSAAAGLAATAPGTPAGRRLGEMHDFYAYLQRELPALIDRWREGRHPEG